MTFLLGYARAFNYICNTKRLINCNDKVSNLPLCLRGIVVVSFMCHTIIKGGTNRFHGSVCYRGIGYCGICPTLQEVCSQPQAMKHSKQVKDF